MNKLKSKKGYISFEVAIGTIVFLMVICTALDISGIIRKFNGVSQVNSYVTRTIGKQGGVRMDTPNNFAGDYTNSRNLYQNVLNIMNYSGIEEEDWTLKIDGYIVSNETNLPLKDYKENIKVDLTVNYNWDNTESFLPFQNLSFERTSTRNVISTYKNRNGSFQTDYR